MKNGWRECRLGDFFKIKHGYAFKGEYFGTKGTHVVLTPGNFFDEGGFKSKGEKEKWYSGEIPTDYILQKGELLVAMTEQAEGLLGSAAIVPQSDLYLHNQRLGLVQTLNGIDSRFLYYLFNSALVRQQIRSTCSGVKVRHTSPSRIYEVKVTVPDLPTQRKIAGILSAYDDLIENNLRRIKILEEMAQSLYREWFVDFRFPGHESARFTESEIGRVPSGWDVKAVTEAVTVRPKVSIPKGGVLPFVTMGGLSENSMLITEVESRDSPTGARFQNGDTLFARITPCLENGKTGFVEFLPFAESAACGSTEFIVLRAKTVCPQYVYLMARSDAFRDNAIKSMSGATGRQRVRDECFDQFFVAQPPEDLLARFESVARPQFELIHSLNRRNQNLRHTRDLLLPKLLQSGC